MELQKRRDEQQRNWQRIAQSAQEMASNVIDVPNSEGRGHEQDGAQNHAGDEGADLFAISQSCSVCGSERWVSQRTANQNGTKANLMENWIFKVNISDRHGQGNAVKRPNTLPPPRCFLAFPFIKRVKPISIE